MKKQAKPVSQRTALWRVALSQLLPLVVLGLIELADALADGKSLAAMGDGLALAEVAAWVRSKVTVEPEPKLVKAYDQWYPEFQGLYGDLKKRFQRLAELAEEK